MTSRERMLSALRCPDDGAEVHLTPRALCCTVCGVHYERLSPDVVNMLPTRAAERPPSCSEDFWNGYLVARAADLALTTEALPWGAPGAMAVEWVQRRQRYSQRIVSLVLGLIGSRAAVAVDISAGAGFVSLELATRGVATIHADLDPNSVAFAHNWMTGASGSPPLLVVRSDYFSPPFHNSADVIIATDTLIRGPDHELAVLGAIGRALTADGRAVLDLHNWLHNPFRRLGLMRNTFQGNRSYFRAEVGRLMRAAGLEIVAEYDYRQEEDQGRLMRKLSVVVPPTRFVVVVRRSVGLSTP